MTAARLSGRILALACAITGWTARASAQTIPGDDEIRGVLQQRIAEGRAVGLVVGVLEADGTTRIIHAGSAGAGAQPLGEHTLFEIGSITKVFTGALLAEMVRRGEVSLTDAVGRYLPQDVRMPTRGGREITLLDLATHRSGLPRLPSNMRPADQSNPYADYTVDRLYTFLTSHELRRDPGAAPEYSNLGTGLLGHVLARAAGSTYEETLRKRILEPLGLNSTVIALDETLRGRMARGHDAAGQPVPLWDLPSLAGAGALRADVRDMLRWIEANMNAGTDGLDGALRSAYEPRAALAPDGSSSIGLNWIIARPGNRRLVFHNGGTGGFFSWAGFDPDRRIGLVVLSNAAHPVDDIAMHLFDRNNPLSAPPPQRTEVNVPEGVLRDYVGEYQLAPTFSIAITLENGALFLQATGQERLPLFAESESRFFLRVVDAQVSFQRDPAGTVTGLVLHQGGQNLPGRKVR